MFRLQCETPSLWLRIVLHDFDSFLQDHAANERKVSASALKLVVQHPERTELVEALIELAREELEHFQQVYTALRARGRGLAQDAPDPYMGALGQVMRRRVTEEYLLDRLLTFAVVEARACERFDLLADALPAGPEQDLYRHFTRAEARHHGTFTRLARAYFPQSIVEARLDEIVAAEAQIIATLPLRAALH